MGILRSRGDRPDARARLAARAGSSTPRPMLVVTIDTLPGYEIRKVLGQVMGVTARTHNPYSEGVKALNGLQNPQMVGALRYWREEAVQKMVEEAQRRGANAIVGMRFDNREITDYWAEICAYGTAVIAARPRPSGGVAPPPVT